MKKIAISGAGGFIGSHLGKYYLDHGFSVSRIPTDILAEPWELKRYLEEKQPNIIFHLAAYGNHFDQKDPAQSIESNLVYLSNILEASKEVPYDAFVNFSSSSTLLPEKTYYSITKKAGEDFCERFAKDNDKSIVTIRPYSVYGVGEASFRFIPTVIASAKKNVSFNLSEAPRHDWIYVDDFVTAVEKLVEKIIELSGALSSFNLRGQSFDIGTSTATSNKRVVQIIENIHGEKIRYKSAKDMRPYDTKKWMCEKRYVATLERIGWKQKYSLYSGLKAVYDSIT